MTRKHLFALFLVLCLFASLVQPCFAAEVDGGEKVLDVTQDNTETTPTQESAPSTDENTEIENIDGNVKITLPLEGPAISLEDAVNGPLNAQGSESVQEDPENPAGQEEQNPNTIGSEDQNQNIVNPEDQNQNPSNPEEQNQNPDAADDLNAQGTITQDEESESANAQANETEPENPEQEQEQVTEPAPEPEEPEGAPLTNGAVTRASIWATMTPKANKRLEILFMDIGRNDGILLHCGGEYAFIDSGTYGYGVRARNMMRSLGVTHLKYYIGTHAHNDHVGGAGPIIASIPTDRIIVPHWGVYNQMVKKAKGGEKNAVRRVPCTVLTYGQTITLGGATLQCIGPIKIKKCRVGAMKENYNSLVLRVVYGSRVILLTGDAPAGELSQIWKRAGWLMHCDVLKNPHHNTNIKKWYSKIAAKYVVISTSKKAKPSKKMQKNIWKAGSRILCTAPNWNSHTLLVTDGSSLQFYTTR